VGVFTFALLSFFSFPVTHWLLYFSSSFGPVFLRYRLCSYFAEKGGQEHPFSDVILGEKGSSGVEQTLLNRQEISEFQKKFRCLSHKLFIHIFISLFIFLISLSMYFGIVNGISSF
jgi:hypothetical protein